MKTFLQFNPGVLRRFKESACNDEDHESHEEVCGSGGGSTMHRMDSRCLGYAVLMHEMKKEMVEDESNGRFRFGPLMRGGEKVPFNKK